MFDIKIHKEGAFIDTGKGYSDILELDQIIKCPSYYISYWDPSITMRDFFHIIEANPEKWVGMIGDWYLLDYVEEFQNIKDSPPAETDLHYLEVGWYCDLEHDNTKLTLSPTFYGMGLSDNFLGSIGKYGVDFIPLKDLLELEIRLNPQVEIWDNVGSLILSAQKKFSVADVVTGIFWDLTWDGGPKEKEKAAEELRNSKPKRE
jgi:hypothetical protein